MINRVILHKYKYAIIFGCSSALLYCVYYILYIYCLNDHPIITDFVGQVASSLLLASLLTISVEKLNILNSRDLYQKEISKLSLGFLNLFAKEKGKLLCIKDEGFSEKLIDIAGHSHYRENYQVTVEKITNDGYIKFYVNYKVVNLSESDDERKFSFEFDKKREDIIFNELKIHNSNGDSIIECRTKKDLNKIKKTIGHNIKYSKAFILPAGDFVNIEFNINQKLVGSDEKMFTFNSARITKDLIIKIKHEIEKDYEPICSDFHNLDVQKPRSISGYTLYRFNGFSLPFQGFEVKLNKRRNTKKRKH